MPFTPFHFGPGLAIKGLMPKQFSLTMFTLANVVMDIEPIYHMWRIETPLHGFSHTLAGAMFIAAGSALLGRYAMTRTWGLYERWNASDGEPFQLSWRQTWTGALLGTGSHLLLDASMHADMRPFIPLTDANPLLMTAWMLHLHLACVLAGVFGMLLILARAAFQHERV